MDIATEAQYQQELSTVWSMLRSERESSLAEIAALREVVKAADTYINTLCEQPSHWPRPASKEKLAYDAARAKVTLP